MSYEFYAFISYKRGEADEKWARKLQAELERYRIPAADLQAGARPVRGDESAPPKRLKVFRDKSDLGSHLSVEGGLSENLDVSRFLIVICSRRSVQSPYVDAEVRRFVETGRQDQIIPLVIDDLATDPPSRPPSLPPEIEAVAASGDHEETFINLLARLLRVDRDNLRQAHLRASRRRAAFRLTLVAAVLVLTAGLALWAVSAEKRATERRMESEELVDFLTLDLVGNYSDWLLSKKLVAVTDRVREYYERWEASNPKTIFIQAVSLRQRGNVASNIDGRTSDGLTLTSEALGLLEALHRDQPDVENIFLEYSSALMSLASLHFINDEPDKADFYYRESLDSLRAFSERHPDSLRVKGKLARCLTSLAELMASSGPSERDQPRKERYFEEAEAFYREGEELWRKMFRRWPSSTLESSWRFDYAQFWTTRSASALNRNDFRAALTYAAESFKLYENLHAEEPHNMKFRVFYAYESAMVAFIATKLKLLKLADSFVQLSDQLWRDLMAEDPQRVYALNRADLLITTGLLRIEQDRLTEAEDSLNQAEAIVDKLIHDFPERPVYRSSKALIEEYRELARERAEGGARGPDPERLVGQ
jgi:tetratricopeptide (TPR) repeat protein